MSRSIGLSQTASVTLGASGSGMVIMGPSLPRTTWQPVSCVISTSSNNSGTTEFALYQNLVGESTVLGGSLTGSDDTATLNMTLYPGQTLVGVWSGGDDGATATLTIYGTQTVP
jgi:hypothetical protein